MIDLAKKKKNERGDTTLLHKFNIPKRCVCRQDFSKIKILDPVNHAKLSNDIRYNIASFRICNLKFISLAMIVSNVRKAILVASYLQYSGFITFRLPYFIFEPLAHVFFFYLTYAGADNLDTSTAKRVTIALRLSWIMIYSVIDRQSRSRHQRLTWRVL